MACNAGKNPCERWLSPRRKFASRETPRPPEPKPLGRLSTSRPSPSPPRAVSHRSCQVTLLPRYTDNPLSSTFLLTRLSFLYLSSIAPFCTRPDSLFLSFFPLETFSPSSRHPIFDFSVSKIDGETVASLTPSNSPSTVLFQSDKISSSRCVVSCPSDSRENRSVKICRDRWRFKRWRNFRSIKRREFRKRNRAFRANFHPLDSKRPERRLLRVGDAFSSGLHCHCDQ